MNAKLRTSPVRRGDVFVFDETRYATVIETYPGGRSLVRISGTLNGKPSLRVGDMQVCVLKTLPRVGRAQCLDGYYAPLDHDALDKSMRA
ncbi:MULTISPECIES: hypothetical protein [unclassified Dyella]|uniref:hypothetical protein n=1 Tax=Dyella sp. ASV21 TaxID=2795114 RepID=UPI0018EA9485|nr:MULTISPECIES: hypothetical protein [unclassified Dyella]